MNDQVNAEEMVVGAAVTSDPSKVLDLSLPSVQGVDLADLLRQLQAFGVDAINIVSDDSNEDELTDVLSDLGFAPTHDAPLTQLREYECAAAALRAIRALIPSSLAVFVGGHHRHAVFTCKPS